MLKIAICDDDQKDLSNIVSLINDYSSVKAGSNTIAYTLFSNAVDLLAVMENGSSFDLVLLDIIMPLTTGIDAASEIRKFDREVKIAFLTSSSEFAVESYSVNAYSYVLKPVGKASLHSILDRIFSEVEGKTDTWFLVKSKTRLVRVSFNKLEFVEVIGHTIIFHLTDGTALEAVGTMTGLETLLLVENSFIKPHRSYIVNMIHIDTLSPRHIKMRSQTIIPVSKANFRVIKTTYMEFAFNNLNAWKE